MACSKPMSMIQCHSKHSKLHWRCEDCDILLCKDCKDKKHSTVKPDQEHKIINIGDINKQSEQNAVKEGSSSESTQSDLKGSVSLELSVEHKYSTTFGVHYIQASPNNSLWIGSISGRKEEIFSYNPDGHLQAVKLEGDNLEVTSSFSVHVRDIAITSTNDLILADFTPQLKQILHNSDKVVESKYCVEPYLACSVHTTRDNKIVVGAHIEGKEKQVGEIIKKEEGEGAVYVMDKNGVHQKIFRLNNNNQLLFKWPYRIASTSTGTLCVIDLIEKSLVMLGQREVISVYTGHSSVNSEKKQFRPKDVVTTPNDNIIVSDCINNTLHILDNTGNFLTYYNTQEIGIQEPESLALNIVGQSSILYIGYSSVFGNESKLYKLKLSGC